MGIDIYLDWDDMTGEERAARLTGFNVEADAVGYLREAYHGGPYGTEVLMPEAFAVVHEGIKFGTYTSPQTGHAMGVSDYGVQIPAHVLVGRLEATAGAVITRQREVYNTESGPDDPVVQSFVDFVKLVSRLETEGRNPRITASY